MRYSEQELTVDRTGYKKVKRGETARLSVYLQDTYETFGMGRRRSAVIVCPGGGYEFWSDREGEVVALQYLAAGFQTCVLRYSLLPDPYPIALWELAESVKYLKEQAEEFNIDREKIFVAGFSAGGHLAASLGTMWNRAVVRKDTGSNRLYRPAGMILGYPPISAEVEGTGYLFENLIRGSSEEYSLTDLSLEKQVSEDTVPAFLWHTYEDQLVDPMHVILFQKALREKRIPFECHIYQNGLHGQALGSDVTRDSSVPNRPETAGWLKMSVEWIKKF